MDNNAQPVSNFTAASWDVTTLLATPSAPTKVEGVVTKVPVVLGKTNVQVYIEALANLEEPALEINNIKHDLHLEHCEFLQEEDVTKGKLIMSGYVRENVDYTSAKMLEDGTANIGNRRTIMNIPFKCFTKFHFDSEPVFSDTASPVNSEERKATDSRNDSNLYYLNSNEDISYEVVESRIRQVNVKRNIENIYISDYSEETFSSFTVNMAVDATIVILQNQYVRIASADKSGSNNQKNGSSGGNSNSGKNSNGKSNNGKSNNGKSNNGKSNNGKSNNGKSNDGNKNGKKNSGRMSWNKFWTKK